MFVKLFSIIGLLFSCAFFFFQLIRCAVMESKARKAKQKKIQEEREREIMRLKRAAIRAKLRGDLNNYQRFAKVIKYLQNGGKPLKYRWEDAK